MAPCSRNSSGALIDEQEIAFGVVDDEDVRQVVIVDVGNRHAHPFAVRLGKTRLFRDVFEFAVSEIVIQPIGNADVAGGAAIDFPLR